VLRSSNEVSGIWAVGWSADGLGGTRLLGSPVLTGIESPGVVTGNVYWLLLVDEERENTVEVTE